MDAYWRDGLDLEDDAVLARVAGDVGLDGGGGDAGSRAPEILARVAAMGREAAAAGVTGIPTFDVGTSAWWAPSPTRSWPRPWSGRVGARADPSADREGRHDPGVIGRVEPAPGPVVGADDDR